MNVVLISTYELGRQPFGLASASAWLRARGHQVRPLDLSREPLDEAAIRAAGMVAFHVPMHTATRLAVGWVEPVRRLNPRAALCFYGLYAPVNETLLRSLGVRAVFGGECEADLADFADRVASAGQAANGTQTEPVVSLARLQFIVPDRRGLPALDRYAKLRLPDGGNVVSGYSEASRGCKHRCRHCPVVPVYNGAFRVVPREIVLEDVHRQVRAGARHITFGDPDFFNGPRHALEIVRALHEEFPDLTYDATIKVEHLLARRRDLGTLRDTGCLFVTSAVESLDDAVLLRLEKGHTRADFFEVVRLCAETGLALTPTFVPFTPWTTLAGYAELLATLASLGLEENVAPVQLTIRLLVPPGSRLLELEEMKRVIGPFDAARLVHPWRHGDERVDRLQREIAAMVEACEQQGLSRAETFARIECAARLAAANGGTITPPASLDRPRVARAAIPYLTEPWYC